ncbi:hypothetical protein EVAR_84648_1 [Eumeta japonica]|uniref:Uncharacterized protein n=1 Tax=Eumeta variegata TaxID=151549 RepID=A0A4C1UZU3_EUMVA|nr:hypothetical protein EVAR_84648_1 [Eumeta japonica]
MSANYSSRLRAEARPPKTLLSRAGRKTKKSEMPRIRRGREMVETRIDMETRVGIEIENHSAIGTEKKTKLKPGSIENRVGSNARTVPFCDCHANTALRIANRAGAPNDHLSLYVRTRGGYLRPFNPNDRSAGCDKLGESNERTPIFRYTNKKKTGITQPGPASARRPRAVTLSARGFDRFRLDLVINPNFVLAFRPGTVLDSNPDPILGFDPGFVLNFGPEIEILLADKRHALRANGSRPAPAFLSASGTGSPETRRRWAARPANVACLQSPECLFIFRLVRLIIGPRRGSGAKLERAIQSAARGRDCTQTAAVDGCSNICREDFLRGRIIGREGTRRHFSGE